MDKEAEVKAHVTVPTDGGWGWVVVLASFSTMVIQNGILLSFGTIANDIRRTFGVTAPAVALINSIQTSLNFLCSPIAAAFINRYGFRACSMFGSTGGAITVLIGSLAPTYGLLLLFYGIFYGICSAFLNMASLLVVGFYFEKRRTLAISLATNGYSVGYMAMFPINLHLVKLSGWRSVVMLEAGLVGFVYFLSLTYRPILTLTVETIESASSTTSLESVASLKTKLKDDDRNQTRMERFMRAISISKYPTAASILKENESPEATTPEAGTSTRKSVVIRPIPNSTIGEQQMSTVRRSFQLAFSNKTNAVTFDENFHQAPARKGRFWKHLFHWERHHSSVTPLYRDDTFYEGKITNLKAYKEHVDVIPEEERTGLEYQLAVTRVTSADKVKEKFRWFPTASRRILATMLDFSVMLKVPSFRWFCLSGFLWAVGFYVPFVFLTDRNKKAGVHSDYYISLIGISTIIGRFFIDTVVSMLKLSAVKVYALGLILSGLGTFFSDLSFTFGYQYFYCVIFGIWMSVVSALRVVAMVDLFGLSNLTNATGILFLFLGCGAIISTPIAAELRTMFNYGATFRFAGIILFLSGFIVIWLRKKEDES